MQADLSLMEACSLASNEEAASAYLKQQGFGAIPWCSDCGRAMTPLAGKADLFRCGKCRCKRSSFHNTIFSNCKGGRGKVLLIGFLWISGVTTTQIIEMTKCSSATISFWLRIFRQAISFDMKATHEENMIGGPDVIVEIDESKFGKRKHNRGHRVEGVWVVGGVERTPERRMFAISVEDRSAPTLLRLIERYVRPGSIIYTDCWKGYRTDGLIDLEMLHGTVNHTLHFVDPETGVHTNGIEGTWSGIKQKIARRKRTVKDVDPCLLEFVWRRKHEGHLWEGFLITMRDIYDNWEFEEV